LATKLIIENIDAGYGAVRALHGVSLTIENGQTVALLGTNGNGKSTLMKCVMGMVKPDQGSIRLEMDGATHDLTNFLQKKL
jgi:branched-chain amino acid transport system ATP-binding protein